MAVCLRKPVPLVRIHAAGKSKGQRDGKKRRWRLVEDKKDLALVKRAMRGNPKAFAALIEREQEYL